MKEWTIAHSAKGSTWAKHKYIKKVGNRYYYAHDIEAGQRRMKAADKFNDEMREAKTRSVENHENYGHLKSAAEVHYRAALGDIRDAQIDKYFNMPMWAYGKPTELNKREEKKENIQKMVEKGKKKAASILKSINDAADNAIWGGEEKKKKAREAAKEWDRKINKQLRR